jgi:hypothetical protein
LRPRPVNNKNPGEEIKMRLSLVSSLAAAAIIASTSAGLAIPARGVALSEAAKSLELSQQAHYRGHYADRRCVCHVAHRPKVVVRKHFVRKHFVRKHVVRPIVVVEEPEIIVRRRHFVHRPFFVHRAHFVDRPFFHRGHFGGMRFAGHGMHFGGHGHFGRW